MKTLIIPIGPAGCGKSTWWEKSANMSINISADAVRYNLYDYMNSFKEEYEDQVWRSVWRDFVQYLQSGNNIYIDNTNLTKMIRSPFINVARAFGYKIKMVIFKTSAIQILKQNESRKRKVPENVICKQILALQYPEPSEYDAIEIASCGTRAKW